MQQSEIVVQHRPKVTIGLPVFNGSKYLRSALDSIILQTYTDFELIISDNSSTDGTFLICEEYLLKDHRIHYYRNKENFGVAKNHNIVFELSQGEYFKWASYDDILSPTYIAECVKVLDTNSQAILCHSKTGRINGEGNLISYYESGIPLTLDNYDCFSAIISMRNYGWLLLLGLIRVSVLRKTGLLGSYISADRALLAELSLYGSIHEIPKTLFFRREHLEAYTNKSQKLKEKIDWWLGNNRLKMAFPYWRILIEYFKLINRSSLKRFERQKYYFQVFKWVLREGWVLMAMDLGYNILKNKYMLKFFEPLNRVFLKKAGIK